MLLVGQPGQETVALVATTLPTHRTEEGLGRGSLLTDFVRVHGEPQRGRFIRATRTFAFAQDGSPAAYWPRKGLGVFFNPSDERVWAVAVFD